MNDQDRIILIEDDHSVGYLISEYLDFKGFDVVWLKDGDELFKMTDLDHYHLIILDIGLPRMNGFMIVNRMKEREIAIPFLFLTSRAMKVEVLKGLSLGAEDYIIKPVDEEELLLRIRNILRRTKFVSQSSKEINVGKYRYHHQNQQLMIEDERINLTKRESELLNYLIQRQGTLCSRRELLLKFWGKNDYFTRKSMDVFISRLRKYLSQDPAIIIENVHGEGFILRLIQ